MDVRDSAGVGAAHSVRGRTALILVAVMWLFGSCSAQSFARECQRLAAANVDRSGAHVTGSDAICQLRPCGTLPPSPLDFHERLSPQCSNLMAQYRSSWSLEGRSNMLTPTPCTMQPWVMGPTGPFLVSNQQQPIATFAMCTIPKVACTNFRKLLSTLIKHPDAMSTDAFKQFIGGHSSYYPSVYLYRPPSNSTSTSNPPTLWPRLLDNLTPQSLPQEEVGEARLPASMPSFVVGRNPYVKVLSGYLDKMIANSARHDQYTFAHVNQWLGVPKHTLWPNSVAGYREFVKKLAEKGLGNIVCFSFPGWLDVPR